MDGFADYRGNWLEVAQKIRKRDGKKCRFCGTADKELHVHHIVYLSHHGTNQQHNLITLCKPCHESEHGRTFDRLEEQAQIKEPPPRTEEEPVTQCIDRSYSKSREDFLVRYQKAYPESAPAMHKPEANPPPSKKINPIETSIPPELPGPTNPESKPNRIVKGLTLFGIALAIFLLMMLPIINQSRQ
jgi:HNH endonuclease